LKVKCRMAGLVKKGMSACHLSVARGSADDNIRYCSKEGCAVTWGEPVVKGERTDLTTALAENKSLEAFMRAEPQLFCRYSRGIEKLYALALADIPKLVP